MPESLVNTKRRINTIKSTQKITKAMKLVASVKYQRWKKYMDENKIYSSGMKEAMLRTLRSVDFAEMEKPYTLRSYPGNKTLYVVVSSTLGLCGAYNYNLFKTLDPVLKEGDEIIAIGNKAYAHYKNKYKVYDDFVALLDHYTYSGVKRLRHLLLQKYRTKEYNSIVLVYTQYKNSMTFNPVIDKIVPILDLKDIKQDYSYPPLFEPDASAVLDDVLPHYLDSDLYTKLIESEMSELASRRNAMETATDSAEKISAQLQLEYNKARQNAITQEITEVVAGANAGKKEE